MFSLVVGVVVVVLALAVGAMWVLLVQVLGQHQILALPRAMGSGRTDTAIAPLQTGFQPVPASSASALRREAPIGTRCQLRRLRGNVHKRAEHGVGFPVIAQAAWRLSHETEKGGDKQ